MVSTPIFFIATVATLLLSLTNTVWAAPIVKPEAFDSRILERRPLPADFIRSAEENERVLLPDLGWMGDVDSGTHLTFAGYRQEPDALRFCLVVACDPAKDILLLLTLEEGETPLTILSDAGRRETLRRKVREYRDGMGGESGQDSLIRLSLRRAVAENKLGLPVPPPRRIFAVALNFPSHLQYDLAINDSDAAEALSRTRPRLFLKYPPVPPPGLQEKVPAAISGIAGPYDGIDYPSRIIVPGASEGGVPLDTETRLDYEVEIGAVVAQTMTWDSIRDAPDSRLRAAIAGYVLISDTKARNPQVVGKVAGEDREYPRLPGPYLTGDEDLDRALGFWDETTSAWWSYAAGWGNYASVGPFFVTAPADSTFPGRAVISARTYGDERTRQAPVPKGREQGSLYLRQCSMATEEKGDPDRLIWNIPQILRSILAPDSALKFMEGTPQLEPGDIISLGTPGGTVITAKSYQLFNILEKMVFWWDPVDWHDAFFGEGGGLYLRHGDELFFWAEGLGFQHHRIRRIDD